MAAMLRYTDLVSFTQSLSEEEQKLFRLYGKLPTRKDLVGNKLKVCKNPYRLFQLGMNIEKTHLSRCL